jgi:hypothetical protein
MDTTGVTGGIIAVFLWLLFMAGVVSGWIVSMLTMWRGIKEHGVPASNIENECPAVDSESSEMTNAR